jgi:release factor glutamine methyltransferase
MSPIAVSEFVLWLAQAKQAAIAHSIALAELDWLLLGVTDLDRLSLKFETYKIRSDIQCEWSLATLQAKWHQRIYNNVPVQYLVGRTPWRQFDLMVSDAVLIPRPETECIIDLVAEIITKSPELATGNWVDLGTGSGAIAIALADLMPDATIHAIDTSLDALAIAKLNSEQLGNKNQIQFYHGSWFEPIAHLRGKLSGMVSNPPYIPSKEVLVLQPEVKDHEPHLALDGGEDGLDCLRHLVKTAPEYLVPSGLWMVEMMMGQMDRVVELLEDTGYEQIVRSRDLEGVERFAIGRCGERGRGIEIDF